MTEADWFAAHDPRPLLELVRGQVTERKLRLFGCTSCWRLWTRMPWLQRLRYWGIRPDVLRLIATALRAEDGPGSDVLGDPIWDNLEFYGTDSILFGTCCAIAETTGGHTSAIAAVRTVEAHAPRRQQAAELMAAAGLLREIVGNPFRPVVLEPGWRTPEVLALARDAYEDARWDDLPVLADALEDAGCAHADLLGHLRSGSEHVRGCWALDLTLGKE